MKNRFGWLKCALFAVVGLVFSAQGLYAQVTLPDTGVDVAEYVTEAISTMGTVMAAVVGGYVAFLIVKRGMRYIGRAI